MTERISQDDGEGFRIGRLLCAGGWMLLTLAVSLAQAQETTEGPPGRGRRPPLSIAPAASKISLDGVLDEPAWQSAAALELRYETEPAENAPPPVRTEVRFTYDSDHFYVGFRAHDPSPAEIRAHLADRDTTWRDDFVGIVLDTFNDERRGFEFFANPLGVQMDLFRDDVGGSEDASWDAIWDAAGKIHGNGYDVEIAIPWSSLRFPHTQDGQTWGFDALRYYPRNQRHRISSHPIDRNVTCNLCQASKLTGFAGIAPGRNLEVAPTVTTHRTDARDGGTLDRPLQEGDIETEPGLTTKWGITPNLTLNAALNPDFSQVEADAAQLDVNTRFALFFAEKRPLFLEGADFFRTPLEVVFTRNIADPDWGLKLTGKQGKSAVGFFAARDDRTNVILPGSTGSELAFFPMATTDAVLRYRRDLGSSSTLGALYTGREGDSYSSRLGGLDSLWRINDSNHVRAQLLRSRTEYPIGNADNDGDGEDDFDLPAGTLEDDAVWISYDHVSRNWNAFARYEDVGRDFRADMGFLPRVDYTFLLAGLQRIWYGGRWHRRVFGGDWERREDQSGQLLEEEIEITSVLQGPLQSYLTISGGRRDRFFNDVTFDETFVTAYGEAVFWKIYGGVDLTVADEIDFVNTRAGNFVQIRPSVRLEVSRRLKVRAAHDFQRLDVDGGNLFTANLTQVSTYYQWNVRTLARATFQYTRIERTPELYTALRPEDVDPETERLFTQLLFSYKLNPQTVFFLGYSDVSLADGRIDLTRESRTFFLKIGYAWVP